METLLKQAQALNESLQAAVGEHRQAVAEANQTAAKNRSYSKELDEKAAELNIREASLVQSEGPVKAAEEAKRLNSENVKLAQSIDKAKSELEEKRKKIHADFTAKQAKYEIDLAEVNMQREGNRKLRDELKEKIANAKQTVLDELKAKM